MSSSVLLGPYSICLFSAHPERVGFSLIWGLSLPCWKNQIANSCLLAGRWTVCYQTEQFGQALSCPISYCFLSLSLCFPPWNLPWFHRLSQIMQGSPSQALHLLGGDTWGLPAPLMALLRSTCSVVGLFLFPCLLFTCCTPHGPWRTRINLWCCEMCWPYQGITG